MKPKSMVSFALTKKNFDWALMSGGLVLVAGLGFSLAAANYVRVQLENEARTKFERQAREIQRAIEARLTSYSGLLLEMRGLYRASGDIAHREFREYVRSLELAARYPAVRVINFAEYVRPEGRAAFERRVRGDDSIRAGGYPMFAVKPPGARNEYHVITYMEPFEPYLDAFGIDLMRMPNSMFEELRFSGRLTSSGAVVRHQAGLPVALRLAVYGGGRRRNLENDAFIGSLGMGFSLIDLMHEAVSPATLASVRIRIHNLGRSGGATQAAPGDENLLIDTSSLIGPSVLEFLPAGREGGKVLATSSRLDFGGALLQLSFEAPARLFVAPLEETLPRWVFAIAATISLLLAAFLHVLALSKRGLEEAVRRRSQQLRDANRVLKSEVYERNRLEREVIHALVEERRHFAQELHDNLGQQLTAAAFLIEGMKKDFEPGPNEELRQIEVIDGHLGAVMRRARNLARGLNPISNETGGLASALQHLASDTQSSSGVQCRFILHGAVNAAAADAALDHNLFRLAEQAVGAACRHRGASQVLIELMAAEAAGTLIIKDNGQLTGESPGDDVGLRVMRYRCMVLGLRFSSQREAQGGTEVSIRWGDPGQEGAHS